MKVKYNNKFQQSLEDLFKNIGYMVRYEKGNFKSGYCILKNNSVVVINKYFTQEGKINCLIDILRQIPFDQCNLNEADQKLYEGLMSLPSKNNNSAVGKE
ncbi:hypothetical protein [Microscilla marina]|uniref:Uncharacterized protein n=1 Tax=Microscilla marina ATCC 23134 TaxID=313606 RepID=A1ZEE3_MICM2|nr:hypothetical protein [Microscilla marina]EAY31451.1 conserved hypothetical protein [Microscilla marina ATCC 23134]